MGFPMTLNRVVSRNSGHLTDAAKDDIRRLAEDTVTLERARIRAAVEALDLSRVRGREPFVISRKDVLAIIDEAIP